MSESKDQEQQRRLDELKGKNVAHYSVMLAAVINARIEANKATFTFSSTGIGLLVALQSKLQHACNFTTIAYVGALVAFFISACSTLLVFVSNTSAIKSYIINESEEKTKGFTLKTWKYVNYISFGIGLLLALAFTVAKLF